MGSKLFFYYWTVFGIAQNLRDSKGSDLNWLLSRKKHIQYVKIGYLYHFCALSLSPVLDKGSYIHLYYDTSSLGRNTPRGKAALSSLFSRISNILIWCKCIIKDMTGEKLGFFCVNFWLEFPKMLSILFEILNRFLNKQYYASDMLWFLLK